MSAQMPIASQQPLINPNEAAAALLKDPITFKDNSKGRMHGLDRRTLEAIQLCALQIRFDELRDRVPILTKLANDVGVKNIRSLEDVVPILFKHTVYKSYPVSLLEKSRFTQMTQWLNKLTALDLSTADVSRCRSIDEWMHELDVHTPMELRYSSGTSGTMSFIPQSKMESDRQFLNNTADLFFEYHTTRPTDDKPLSMDVILPNYRRGATAWARFADYLVKYLCGGDESRCHALYPGFVSSDILFLAGRIRAAQKKGELDRLELSPALLARKAEFEEVQRRGPADMQAFFGRLAADLRGRRIFTQAPWSALHNMAVAGLERGVESVFSPDSIVVAAGGSKGQIVPDDWEEKAKRFLGVERLMHLYGMTEVQSSNLICTQHRYHIEPTNVLFILDPDTGEILPRKGIQTGRAAFYDLLASSHWGGFITGDELCVDWDSACPCGKLTPHISRKVERYSEKRGGDDKISCASVSDAHDEALNYLVEISG